MNFVSLREYLDHAYIYLGDAFFPYHYITETKKSSVSWSRRNTKASKECRYKI